MRITWGEGGETINFFSQFYRSAFLGTDFSLSGENFSILDYDQQNIYLPEIIDLAIFYLTIKSPFRTN